MGNHSKCFKCGELDEFCACKPAPQATASPAPRVSDQDERLPTVAIAAQMLLNRYDELRGERAPAAEFEMLRAALAQRASNAPVGEQALDWRAFDTEEMREALSVYAQNHGQPGEDAAKFEVLEIVAERTSAAIGSASSAVAGWQSVPMVPTDDMLKAGMRYFSLDRKPATKAWEVYKDMLAAAPAAMSAQGAKEGGGK